jgi:O-antigen/teichoic acid export membrane protein
LDYLLIREVSIEPDGQKNLITNVFIIKIVLISFSYAILLLILYLTPISESVKFLTIMAAPFVIFSVLAETFDDLLQAHNRFNVKAYISIIQTGLLTLSGILVIILKYTIREIIFFFVFTSFIRFLLTFLSISKYIKNQKLTIDIDIIFSSLKISSFLFLPILIGNIYYYVDNYLLSFIKSEKSVGLYSPAVMIYGFIIVTPGIITTVLFPILSKLFNTNKNKFMDSYRKSMKLLIFLSIILLVIFEGISSTFITIMISPKFHVTGIILKILLMALPFTFCNALFVRILVIIDKQNFLVLFSLLVTSLNILLNLLLIPKYDYFGAAIATVIGEFAGTICGILMIKRFLNERLPYRELIYPVLFLITSYMVSFSVNILIKMPEIFIHSIAMILFILLSVSTKTITLSEINKIKVDLMDLFLKRKLIKS